MRALLWDVDGTLAETERDGHRVAFNRAFGALGLPRTWDAGRYGTLLRVTGGVERLLHDMEAWPEAPADPAARLDLARRLHALKTRAYADIVATGAIALRPGVRALLDAARERGLRQAIVTTTSRANVAALLGAHLGPDWADRFDALVCGEDVARKKPDPEAHRRALDLLGMEAAAALAIEDSPAGVAAARAAGVPVIVTRGAYFAACAFEGALAVGEGFGERSSWRPPARSGEGMIGLEDLRAWHARDARSSLA